MLHSVICMYMWLYMEYHNCGSYGISTIAYKRPPLLLMSPIYFSYLFFTLRTNHSQSLPPYPTESELYPYLYLIFFY